MFVTGCCDTDAAVLSQSTHQPGSTSSHRCWVLSPPVTNNMSWSTWCVYFIFIIRLSWNWNLSNQHFIKLLLETTVIAHKFVITFRQQLLQLPSPESANQPRKASLEFVSYLWLFLCMTYRKELRTEPWGTLHLSRWEKEKWLLHLAQNEWDDE